MLFWWEVYINNELAKEIKHLLFPCLLFTAVIFRPCPIYSSVTWNILLNDRQIKIILGHYRNLYTQSFSP